MVGAVGSSATAPLPARGSKQATQSTKTESHAKVERLVHAKNEQVEALQEAPLAL